MLRENAKEGEFGDQSGFSGGVGGASKAAIGAEELTVPHRLWPKKKKKKKPAAVSTAPVVCSGVLQHSLAASRAFFLLEEAPLRARDKPTQPCRLAHTAPRCSLSSSAVPGLHALLTPGCPVPPSGRVRSLSISEEWVL